MDALMTMDDVSSVLRVPVNTLRKWRSLGTGPTGFRQGKRVMYTRAAVEAWVTEISSTTAA